MIPYLFHYILIIFIYLIFRYDINKNINNYTKIYNRLYFFLAIIVALRYGVGVDTGKYMIAFNAIPKIQYLSLNDFTLFRFQPLYLLTNSFSKTINNSFLTLQIIQSFIFFYAYHLVTKALNLQKFYLLLFFFLVTYLTTCMSAMRECFAVSFCLFSILYFLKKKWIKFYLLVFIGFLYHSGAIIFFILPFYNMIIYKANNKNLILFVSGLILSTFFFSFFQDLLEDALSDGSIARYEVQKNSLFSLSNIIKNFIQFIIVYIFVIKKKQNENYGYLIFIGVTYIFIDLISASLIPMLYRFQAYFLIFYLLCIKLIFESSKVSPNLKFFIILIFFYQPISRYFTMFIEKVSAERLVYCSYISSNKTHFNKIIKNSDASDYILIN